MVYLDTGCLVKLYYPEPDSLRVSARVTGKSICYTPLHELELTNALHQKAFAGQATPSQITGVFALISADIAAGVLLKPMLDIHLAFEVAQTFSAQHTRLIGCRSLDILHCAQAHLLQLEDFVSTDARQIRLAQAIGLPYAAL